MDFWKSNNKCSVHLPTVLKCPNTEYKSKIEEEKSIDIKNELVEESSSFYLAKDINKRQLVKDALTISGRHLDVFSETRKQIMSPITTIEMPQPSTAIDIFDPSKIIQMPAVRMPNTQQQPDPPPTYSQRQNQRNNPNQRPPQRYQQPPQVYVYYPPDQRREPDNTRDYGPYRAGRRNPTRRLIDRQESDEYLFEKQLRKVFVCKVYLFLSLLLAFSFTCSLITTLVPEVRHFFIDYWWIGFIFLILYLGFSITLMCFTELRRSFPTNLILLCCMCFCITVPMCVATAFYSTKTVLLALGTTILITLTVSFLAKVSPFDVTGCGMLVCILSMVFMLYAMITFIVSLFIYEPLLHLIYGAIGTVLFSFFLFFDTQQILGGRRVELSSEEYILGVVLLYIDTIMIFLMLLNVYGYGD